MFGIRVNEAALTALGGPGFQLDATEDVLRTMVDSGIEVWGEVVVWTGGGRQVPPPGNFPDLTGWECQVNSFHLEDLLPVEVSVSEDDDDLTVDEAGQLEMLRQGLALGVELCRLAYDRTVPLRCVVAVDGSGGTFRFHRIRAGEDWLRTDMDEYRSSKIGVVEAVPPKK